MTSRKHSDQPALLESILHVDDGTDDTIESVDDVSVKKKMKKKSKNKKKRNSPDSGAIDLESIRLYLSNLISRLSSRISIDTLRPLPMFLGIDNHAFCLSTGAFTPPTKSFTTRVALNLGFFLSNYALVALGVAIVIALLHPGMLTVLGLLWLAWWFHSFLIRHPVTVGETNIATILSISQRSTILSIVTILAVIWKCMLPVVTVAVVSTILILLHASMRDPKHIESYNRGGISDEDDDQVMVERGDVI